MRKKDNTIVIQLAKVKVDIEYSVKRLLKICCHRKYVYICSRAESCSDGNLINEVQTYF